MPVICHAILIELHDRAPDGLMDCHGFVYANTAPESPLRRMLVGMAVHDMRVAGVFQKGPLYGMHSKFLFFSPKALFSFDFSSQLQWTALLYGFQI